MFKHKETGVVFDNRKQAIILMGESRYKRFLKNGEFEWKDEKEREKRNNRGN